MKLKYELEMLEMDGEIVAVPIDSDKDFRGILRINSITADILKQLESNKTEDEVIAALLKEYNATTEDMRESVSRITGQLRVNGLLSE